MGTRVVRFKNLKKKRRLPFETYEPEKRVEFSKEEALPTLVRIGHRLMGFGGFIGLWASSILMGIKETLGFKKKVERFSLNNKVVEIRVRK